MEKIIHKELGHEYYVIEEYQGMKIVVPEPESECHMIYDPEHDTIFILGLDDSKRNGYRESHSTTVQDGRNYLDWITEVRKGREKINS